MSAGKKGTLCFIHGWGFDGRVLEGFMGGFLPEWDVKTLVLPGYNGDAPLALGLESVARALIPDVPDHSILIGWSLGGLIGIRISSLKPVKKLILLASTPCFVKRQNWLFGTEPELVRGLMRRINDDPGRALREFAKLISRGDRSPRATFRTLAMLLERNMVHTSALLDGLDILQNADLRTELSDLGSRAGGILAANDPLVPAAVAGAMLSLNPNMELRTISNSGHVPFISRPEQTRRLLLSMLGHTAIA